MALKQSLGISGPLTMASVRTPGHRRPGFSLIDVLVSIAVVAVLLAVMMPSLNAVRETAHRVICRSNVRQVGFGIELYAQAHAEHLPYTIFAEEGDPDGGSQPEEMMALRLRSTASGPSHWDGLGHLFAGDYLPAPLIFYCPSHHGDNSFDDYAPLWSSTDGQILGNYHYRGIGSNGSSRLDRIQMESPRSALVADGMRTLRDFNHLVGTNVLRADLSVDWFGDNGTLAALLQSDGGGNHHDENLYEAWNRLDAGTGGGR